MAYSAEESSPIAYITDSCCVCDEEFSSDSELTSHLINHANDEVFRASLQELEKKTIPKNSNSTLTTTTTTSSATRNVSGREQPLKRTASQRSASPEVWEIISDDSDEENNKNKKSPRLSNSFRLKRRPPKKRKSCPSFTKEIRYMMHALGDCSSPNWSSVLYMEKILGEQMELLMTEASKIADHRGDTCISYEHLLFLLRKNKVKLKRLLLYLSVRDAKEVLTKPNSSNMPDLVYSVSEGKRVKSCLDFLNEIDNIFIYEDIMLEDIEDTAVTFRNERKFTMVSGMNDEEYLQFSEQLKVSFCPKGNYEMFRQWLMEISRTQLTPTPFAMEIINYLARETIAEVMDMVMLQRKKQNGSIRNFNQTKCIQSCAVNSEVQTMKINPVATSIVNKAVQVPEIEQVIRFSLQGRKRSTGKYHLHLKAGVYIREPTPDYLLCC